MKRRQLWTSLGIGLLMLSISACNTGKAKEDEMAVVQEISSEAEEEMPEEMTEAESEPSSQEMESETLAAEQNMETGQIISISMEEMEEKLAAKEDFMVSFVTIDCPYCQDFHSMLVDYIQEHIVTMYQVILDYEEEPEEENRKLIKEYFSEFNTVPGVFYVENGENASYLDTYNLGVGMEVFDQWVQELNLEAK